MYYRTIWNIDLTKTHVLNLWRNAPRLTCRFGFISLTPLRKRNKIRTECPCWLSLKNLPHVMEMCSAVRGFSNGCCLVGFLLLNCLLFTLRVWQIKIFSFQKLIGISYLLLYKKNYLKTYWLTGVTILFVYCSVCQPFGLGSTGRFFCFCYLGSLMQL